ncbi:MAG: (5-formylfuran-3-yl)methyl phosphate synthase [Candidatus Helarchaeota archaeon]
MKLLVSPINIQEAQTSIAGGADIIDVKNPLEGSLGANFPWIITKIQKLVKEQGDGLEISATLGDFPNLPGTASLAALGLASCNVNYIKVGLKGPKSKDDAIYFMKQVKRAVSEFNEKIKVVVAGYADNKRFGTIDPNLIPEIAIESEVDVAMVDTGIKDGKNLFDFMSMSDLEKFVTIGKDNNIIIALAGSVKKEHFPKLKKLNPNIIGLRGAACEKHDRVNGKIKLELVKELKLLLE